MFTVTPLGAARNVTGSRHLIEVDGIRVLVDCGLYQEREYAERNWGAFPVPPSSIHAVVLTHAHLDHCGYLPRLAKQGFTGLVWATAASVEIAQVVLADSAHLQVEDARWKAKRHAREGRTSAKGLPQPLYDEDDVDLLTGRWRGVPFAAAQEVAPGIRITWLPAGHILGAAMLLVEAKGKRLLLSGDLGRWDRPLVPDPVDPPAADLVLVESTYGDRLHHEDVPVVDQLATAIGDAAKAGGVVLVPSFAVERAQEILWHLETLWQAGRIPPMPVYLDSPMAIRLLEVFKSHPEALDTAARSRFAKREAFGLGHLVCTTSREESQALNRVQGPAMIISGSGMLTGGRIKHHLDQRIGDARSTLLFVGYQAAGTLGRQLIEGARRVRLFGREREVAIRVSQVQGFSGHADRDELLGWLGRMPTRPGKVAVIHGGPNVAPAFAALVQEKLGVPASAPQYLEAVEV